MNADIHSLVGAYAVDAVDDAERAAFEQHLAQCPECGEEVASLRAAAADLSLLTETAPPSSMRDSVLARVAIVRPLPPQTSEGTAGATSGPGSQPAPATPVEDAPAPATVVPLRRRRTQGWLVAAAAAVALAIGGLVWSPWSGDEPGRGPVSAVEQVLEAKDAQRFVQQVDGARATIVRSPSLGKAVLIADNMPAAPDGKDFQVWLDQPGRGMVNAGVMPHGSSPTLTVELQGDAATATGAGITVEPAGGSKEPTSTPVVLFAFS